ncbi:unnamed protein product [Notodromas monacha]|uniref:Cathepsin F n=1 Tax=Notodromas monacha TaxID=399045 RepID=A0A7R9BJZ1_9CRUS|nr:unnamed protein product [Notodromas monacha]CAG0916083.1 unnamed protein product [Notodromas monacha]
MFSTFLSSSEVCLASILILLVHSTLATTLGGNNKINVKDPRIQEILEWTESFIDRETNSVNSVKLFSVIDAKKQIVSGVKYDFDLELAHTSCPKISANDSKNCGFDHSLPHVACKIQVYDQPWTKTRKVLKFSCSDSPTVEPFMKKFETFEKRHKKEYSPEERKRRFAIFKENMLKIAELQKNEQGTAKYGPTKFADLSEEEFKKQFLGFRPDLKSSSPLWPVADVADIEIPEAFDWRDHDAVTPVKNQGFCGSCWAFSVTGNVEGQWAIKRGKLIELSEQELVDCDTLDQGCNGGLMENAYKSLAKLGGLESEAGYPYDGRGESCKFNKTAVRASVTGGFVLPKNETLMAQWLVRNGPISIGINANAMQFYFGGVSHPWKALCSAGSLDHGVLIVGYGVHSVSHPWKALCSAGSLDHGVLIVGYGVHSVSHPWKALCSAGSLDHGVLIVGYGVHKTKFLHRELPYWIVKNSWGRGWGEKVGYLSKNFLLDYRRKRPIHGYYLVYRGDGTCGVDQEASSATVM